MREIQELQVGSLGREDPLQQEMATHSSILAWRIPMDRGAWWAIVNAAAKSWTQLMAPHSSTLAWKIPWMEEPGRLQSMGLLRVGHD